MTKTKFLEFIFCLVIVSLMVLIYVSIMVPRMRKAKIEAEQVIIGGTQQDLEDALEILNEILD